MSLPSLAAALVETLSGVANDLAKDRIVDPDRLEPLARQASLALAGVEKGCPLPEDAAAVRDAAEIL